MRYYIIAGEASGDLHGSNLMKGLLKKEPQAEIRFRGGDKMAAVGGVMAQHYRETAVMGVVEIAMNLRKILNDMERCKKDILNFAPDVVILIDYPGFNLKIAKFARNNGIKVFYYIAPKVWAWNEKRVKLLRKYVDGLFIIFPFEIDYFKKKGLTPTYRGNPLIDSIEQDKSAHESRADFLERNHLSDKQIVALLPGSRSHEIKFLMPIFVKIEKLMQKSELKDMQLIIAGAPSTDPKLYDKYLVDSNIKVLFSETYSILKHADAAIVNSGTASLETALIGTPQVVAYGINEITYRLAKMVLKIKYISLANIILDKLIFKEMIQHDCTAENLFAELKLLVENESYRSRMIADYNQVRTILGGSGASEKIAEAMIEALSKK